MATQCGPPKTPIIKAVMANELCMVKSLVVQAKDCQRSPYWPYKQA
jgi:hypothetical protein